MELDYELVRNLILVIVPTTIGVVGSNVLINTWQIRKEKFALRKEILSSFNDTYPKANALIYQLFVRVSQEYTIIPRGAKMTNTTVEGKWNFPENEEEQPRARFSEEYKKLVVVSMEIQQKGHNFDGTLSLYFRDTKKMDALIYPLIDSMEKTTNELKRMIYADNLKGLMDSVPILTNHFNENFRLIIKLNNLLITERLKNPQEAIWDFSFFKHRIRHKIMQR